MEDKLTKEEVLHVADLARIEIDEDELEMYQVKLKQILNEIEKINDVNINDNNILITPTENECILREDKVKEMLEAKQVLENAPRHNGNYFSVPVVIKDRGEGSA